MLNLFFTELRERAREVSNTGDYQEVSKKLVATVKQILHFSVVSRKEGLLALDAECENLDLESEEKYLYMMVRLIVDGTEAESYEEICFARYFASNLSNYEGLIFLMYLQGMRMIQKGNNLYVIEEALKAMLPEKILKEYETQKTIETAANVLSEEKMIKEKIDKLCKPNVDEKEAVYSIIGQTSKTLAKLSDEDMQRLLREIDYRELEIAMKGLSPEARRNIFNNLSNRLISMIIEDMDYMGLVKKCDVVENVAKMASVLLKLADHAEIADEENECLRIVFDIYTSGKNVSNQKIEKYKELKRLLDNLPRMQ